MAVNIKSVEGRNRLKARREPYWERLRKGCYLGFRKGSGTWIARWRDPEGKQHYTSLGEFDQVPPSDRYDLASKAAGEWFDHLEVGGRPQALTVADACRVYVQHLRLERREQTAADTEARYRRWIDADRLGAVELAKLRHDDVQAWRSRLTGTEAKAGKEATRKRSLSTINRDMTALRAALNHAHLRGMVASDGPWRAALRPHENAGKRRDVYLDRKQRRALIDAAAPDVGHFLTALSLLPLRPGALAALNVGDFDKRLAALRVGTDKAGADRVLPLPKQTATFFSDRCKGALPTAPLLRRADGTRWNKDAWKGPIKEAVAAAKLPANATAYSLRHSTITDLCTAGLDVLAVAQLSGTSVLMIQKHYGHLVSQHARDALAGLAL